ncbi:fimbrial protein [Enterobacter asburiae]|uniref:fimbrial protein n=1 Tax=Enterobacter asburiae TaxID=61645 RepID=UPI0020065770|nr:fimbrial protein [Enterobacter asburiae]MCK7230267.1 fimbrial protein [Enterobacter asburiae]
MKTFSINDVKRCHQITKCLLVGILFISIFSACNVRAGIMGAPGLAPDYSNMNSYICGNTGSTVTTKIAEWKGNACTIAGTNSYVPTSGYYTIGLIAWSIMGGGKVITISSSVFIDADKPISEQSLRVNSSDDTVPSLLYNKSMVKACYVLRDSKNTSYSFNGFDCDNKAPLPPTPPLNTACTLNSGNALDVNLGTVDRSQLTTTPGVGSVKHIQVNVNCTGGVDVTVNMQLNYTPISITGTQIVKSTANGLGVAIIYNGKTLASTDVTPVTFLTGSNALDLSFQAVRDPTVDVGDVPTGAFTASAVLVMTQQ